MYLGVPIIADNSGGPKEFVTEECGRLINSLDKNEWATRIVAYLDSHVVDANFRNQVRESARSFDWGCSLRPALETINNLCSD